VIEIITENNISRGLLAVNAMNPDTDVNPLGLTMFSCVNIVYATGGPSAIYASTVYPESQTCAHGAAFRAGAEGVNLTESQYGIASTKFRWNLSGTFQQVIPRYISTKEDGVSDPTEFIGEAFDNIFYKGYQWPFDPRKISGSSSVDMAIYGERLKGRRTFIDFTHNPEGFSIDKLTDEARSYLAKSGAVQDSPIKRLRHMNNQAYELYLSHGIDLEREPIEIDVCAQHNNGGLAVDIRYESSIKHLFAVGEVCGIFGVYRPGGSALNSTQVSSLRASQHIASEYKTLKPIPAAADSVLLDFYGVSELTQANIMELRRAYGERMSMAGAFIRNYDRVCAVQGCVENELRNFAYRSDDPVLFTELTINYDILVTQYVYLSAIREYIEKGGRSRGSYLINDNPGIETALSDRLCYIKYADFGTECRWERTHPIPSSEQWFENIYNKYKKHI
ncbi:MAG: oxidoreductase, partial [Eubacteriales bacterium]|nr:oxidoreductase [Eubacteriales bacterium]